MKSSRLEWNLQVTSVVENIPAKAIFAEDKFPETNYFRTICGRPRHSTILKFFPIRLSLFRTYLFDVLYLKVSLLILQE